MDYKRKKKKTCDQSMTIDVEKLREKTQRLLAKQKHQQALKLYESSLERDPNYPDLWCELGSLQRVVGNSDGSCSSYFRAAEMYVKVGEDRYALAACQKAVQSGGSGEAQEGARRLLKVLSTRIKESKGRRTTPSDPAAGTAATSLLHKAARSGLVRLGEARQVESPDYDEIDTTPLPPPLSALRPVQRRQASDFVREPTSELDLDEFASASSSSAPFKGSKQFINAAPPPPPISYWEELKLGPKPKPPRKPHPVPQRQASTAPKERFMVLSRRDAGTLLAGLRSGQSYGIGEAELTRITKESIRPEERTFQVLKRSLLFEGLSRNQLLVHAPPGRVVTFQKGESIASSGSGAERIVSILSGSATVIASGDPPLEIATLLPGAILGEQSFVGTVGMKAIVKAADQVEAVALSRAQAEELLSDHPASLYAMLRVVEERVVDNMLQRAGFFRLFSPEERDQICPRFEILEVADDEVIVEQGTPSKTLCLLMSGTIELSHTNAHNRTVRMLLDPGGVFGEESLIDGRPQVFTARTTARSWIMLLRREEYLQIYERHPVLVRSLKDVLRRRRRLLDQVDNGEIELMDARWPDFDPATVQDTQLKPKKDRGAKKS